MELVKVINGAYRDERALVNLITGEVYAKGDAGEENIDEYIAGIVAGLRILEKEVDCVIRETFPGDYLFEICAFLDEEEL